METKMKKIPFDLELAKKGEAFRFCDQDYSDNYYVSNNSSGIVVKWFAEGHWNRCSFDLANAVTEGWFHLIPDEPKAERWAVIYPDMIYDSKEKAIQVRSLNAYPENFTVVKIADDEN